MYKKVLLLTFFITITSLVFIYDENEYTTTSEVLHKKDTVEKLINIDSKTKTKTNNLENQNKEDTNSDEIINNKKYLFKSRNSSGKYFLSIVTDRTIETPVIRTSYNYFPFPGIIEDNEGKTNFSLSLREDYLEQIDNLFFELHDITTNKKVQCPVNIVSPIEKNYIYNIKFDYFNEELNCILISSKKRPLSLIEQTKSIPDRIELDDLPIELREKIINKIDKS